MNDSTINEKYYARSDNRTISTTRANTSKVHIHVSKPFNVILCCRHHGMEGEV